MVDTRQQVDPLVVCLNQEDAFNEAVHGKESLPFGAPIRLLTKDRGTESGCGIACITFDVELPDGTLKTAQAVTTIFLLRTALRILEGRYDEEGRLRVGVKGGN